MLLLHSPETQSRESYFCLSFTKCCFPESSLPTLTLMYTHRSSQTPPCPPLSLLHVLCQVPTYLFQMNIYVYRLSLASLWLRHWQMSCFCTKNFSATLKVLKETGIIYTCDILGEKISWEMLYSNFIYSVFSAFKKDFKFYQAAFFAIRIYHARNDPELC